MNRVISLTPIEKPCQLMIVLAVLVMVRVLPEVAKVALPELTLPPVGLAALCVAATPKYAATESAISLGLRLSRCMSLALDMVTLPVPSFPQQTGNSF